MPVGERFRERADVPDGSGLRKQRTVLSVSTTPGKKMSVCRSVRRQPTPSIGT